MFSKSFLKYAIPYPHNVKRIGTSAFNSSGITSIVIGAQLKRISHLAFAGCDNLQSVTFEVCFGWTVTDKENSTTGDAVTISATEPARIDFTSAPNSEIPASMVLSTK